MSKLWLRFTGLTRYLLFTTLLTMTGHSYAALTCESPQGWLTLAAEQAATDSTSTPKVSSAAIDLKAGKVPLGQPFSFKLHLCSATDNKIDRVSATAIMPAHLHGMNYLPKVTKDEDSSHYQVEDFLFHMPGAWKVTVSVYTGQVAEHFSIELMVNTHSLNEAEVAQALTHGPWPPKATTSKDPSNRVSGNPEAITFGKQLFFSQALSKGGQLSCASCHDPRQAFASGEAIKTGLSKPDRNTLSLFNQRLNRWFGWDGRNDNLWAQSLRPITHAAEMNLPPAKIRNVVKAPEFAAAYTTLFGKTDRQDDELILVNVAKALAAYQETLVTGQTAFDTFRDGLARDDKKAVQNYPLAAQRGLAIFAGRGRCIMCHSGPQFSNGEFHDVAIPFFIRPGVVDSGRHQGIIDLKASPYTLDGRYSDDPQQSGAWAVRKVATQHANFGIFRVPGLRNVAKTAPYMHNGSLQTLEAVVRHYSTINMERLHADGEAILRPLNLSETEIKDLVAFLETLSD